MNFPGLHGHEHDRQDTEMDHVLSARGRGQPKGTHRAVPPEHDEKRRNYAAWALLGLIVFGGLVLRVAYLREIAAEPGFTQPTYDPQYNDYWARGLATGDWSLPEGVNDPRIRTTPHGRPPGYPYFLAGVYTLFGTSYLAPRLVQMTLGLVNVVLLFLLARRLFGRAAALLAAAFMAGYWVFIYFEGVLTYPAVAILLLLCLMHSLGGWAARPNWKRALLAGLLLGVFGLFRPNGLLFLPVAGLWMAWVAVRNRTPRAAAASCTALLVGVMAALAPPMVRNYLVADDFVFISSYGGINLYVGNNPEASGVEPRIPGLQELTGSAHWNCFDYPRIVDGLAQKLGRENLSFSEANRYFYGKALEFLREHPGGFLRQTARKIALFWGPEEVTNDTVPALDKAHSKVLAPLPGFPWVAGLFLVGAMLALAGWWRKDKNVPAGTHRAPRDLCVVLALFVPVYFLSVLPYFVAARYRVPLIPFLLLFGAYGVVRIVEMLARGPRWRGLAWLAVAAATVALAHIEIVPYEPSAATWHFRRGVAAAAAGDKAGAIHEYEQAIAAGSDTAAVYANLGRLLMDTGRSDEALRAFEAALARAPEDATIHNTLGHELARLGRPKEAITHYRRALESDPMFALAHLNLGHALAEQGKHAEALEHYTKAQALRPTSPAAHYNAGRMHYALGQYAAAEVDYRNAVELEPCFALALNNLGLALTALGQPEKARRALAKAVECAPDFILARQNLGNLLVERGELDAAQTQYLAVLEQAPEDADAWYNLGRVAMLRGDAETAAEHYEKALELRPGFAQAHNNLGLLHADAGALDTAIPHFQAALEARPDFQRACVNLAATLERAGRLEAAAKQYERALELAPENAALKKRLEHVRNTLHGRNTAAGIEKH